MRRYISRSPLFAYLIPKFQQTVLEKSGWGKSILSVGHFCDLWVRLTFGQVTVRCRRHSLEGTVKEIGILLTLVTLILWSSTSFATGISVNIDTDEWENVTPKDFQPYGNVSVQYFSSSHVSGSSSEILNSVLQPGHTRVNKEFNLDLNGHQTQVKVSVHVSKSNIAANEGRPHALIRMEISAQKPKPFRWIVSNFGSIDAHLSGAEYGIGKDVYAEAALGFYLFARLRVLNSLITCQTSNS